MKALHSEMCFSSSGLKLIKGAGRSLDMVWLLKNKHTEHEHESADWKSRGESADSRI